MTTSNTHMSSSSPSHSTDETKKRKRQENDDDDSTNGSKQKWAKYISSKWHYFIFCYADSDGHYEFAMDGSSFTEQEMVKFDDFICAINDEEDKLMRHVYWEAVWHFVLHYDDYLEIDNIHDQMKKRLIIHDKYDDIYIKILKQINEEGDLGFIVNHQAMMVHPILLKHGDSKWCC